MEIGRRSRLCRPRSKPQNRLVAERVIENYAIGGAIGASFYLPAMQTEGIDVFVFLPYSSGPLVSLTPIYDALKVMGGVVEREFVRFGDWPVQILTDATALIREAIREAVDTDYDGIPARVFTPEHLCAIALQTGRAKDYARVILFLEENEVDRQALSALAARFGLSDRLQSVLVREGRHDVTQDPLKSDEEKTAFNARAKASMRVYLKSRTWSEKIASIKRMNEAAKIAREGMRKTRGRKITHPNPDL